MGDLLYPEFPRRIFVVGAVVMLALIAAAVVINLRGPSVARCTAAALSQVSRSGWISPAGLRACDGLSTAQITAAETTAYQAVYGKYLRGTPMTRDLPPASYRAASARAVTAAVLSRP